MNVGGVSPFMDAAVLLSRHSSLLAGFSRFRDAIAELTA